MTRDKIIGLGFLVFAIIAGLFVFAFISGDDQDEIDDSGFERDVDESDLRGPNRKQSRTQEQPSDLQTEAEEKPEKGLEFAPPEEFCGHVWGVVRDKSGQPIAGAVVALCRDVSDFSQQLVQGEVVAHAVSAADGRFEVLNVNVAAAALLRAGHQDFASKFMPNLRLEEGQERFFEIVLAKGFTVSGIVQDENGEALPGAKVQVSDQTIQIKDKTGGVEREIACDKEGKFRVDHLLPGFKRIAVSKAGFATETKTNYHLGPRNSGRVMTFKLGLGFELSGRVVDNYDHPVANFEIAAQTIAGGKIKSKYYPPIHSNENGEFRYTGLREGSYRLVGHKPGYFIENAGLTCKTGQHGLTMRVSKNPVVKGRVIDAETGQPVKSFRILATPKASMMFASQREAKRFGHPDGEFEFPCQRRAGPLFLHVEADNYAGSRSEKLTLVEGQDLEGVLVALPRGATLKGVVQNQEDVPLAKARLRLLRVTNKKQGLGGLGKAVFSSLKGHSYSGRSDKEGKFEFKNVRAGVYRLRAERSGYAPYAADRLIEVTQNVDRDLPAITLGRGGSLKGQVRDKNDKPVFQALVRISARESQIRGIQAQQVTSDRNGNYRFPNLHPGGYWIEVMRLTGQGRTNPLYGGLPSAIRQEVYIQDNKVAVMDLAIKEVR